MPETAYLKVQGGSFPVVSTSDGTWDAHGDIAISCGSLARKRPTICFKSGNVQYNSMKSKKSGGAWAFFVHAIFATLAIVVLLAIPMMSGCAGLGGAPSPKNNLLDYGNTTVIVATSTGYVSVNAQIARTQEQQEFGLMFRTSLPEGAGMIFPFAKAGNYGFYMKNMRMPIDIIYAKPAQKSTNENLQGAGNPANAMKYNAYEIIKITSEIQPCRQDPCPLDYSGDGASMVLEVPAGFANRHGVRKGDALLIPGGILS